MNDRLEIASRVLAGLVTAPASADDRVWSRSWRIAFVLDEADELIKQEALTRVKKEAEEHK